MQVEFNKKSCWISAATKAGWVLGCGLLLSACNPASRGHKGAEAEFTPWHQVRSDMNPREVIGLLGEPDRRAIQDGKLLRNVSTDDPRLRDSRFRHVYIYEAVGIQIWFGDGRVTGMTQNGVSILGTQHGP